MLYLWFSERTYKKINFFTNLTNILLYYIIYHVSVIIVRSTATGQLVSYTSTEQAYNICAFVLIILSKINDAQYIRTTYTYIDIPILYDTIYIISYIYIYVLIAYIYYFYLTNSSVPTKTI